MIVALGSIQREATGIIRSGDYVPIDAPEDFIAYRPQGENSNEFPAIVLSGTGSDRAARATQWAIDELKPDAIISFGFCSATKDHARSGDIVIAARVINLPGTPFEWSIVDETDSLGPDRSMLLAARTAVEISGLDHHHGTIITLSKFATTSGTKRWLGEAINATAVDTAAHSVASTANKAGIPWAIVSSVLDDRDFEAPKIVDRMGTGPNERGITAYVKHLSNKPFDLPSLMRLGRASTRATASLTTFMSAFMEARSALQQANQPAEID
jgi:adenosylhomocysteine nucleosidase